MIVGSMATYPARAHIFWNAAETIAAQVDVLYIVLNEFEAVPKIANVPSNVRFILPKQDLKDVGKFLPEFGDDDIVFLTDDDILYPSDYVERTLISIKGLRYSGRCIYGYHGTRYLPATFRGDLDSAIGAIKHRIYGGKLRRLRKNFFYEDALAEHCVVDQLGSGVAVARGRDLPKIAYMNGSQNFVDVRLARWCFESDISSVCLPRAGGWLHTQVTNASIYQTFTRRTPAHVLKEIYAFAGHWKLQKAKIETT